MPAHRQSLQRRSRKIFADPQNGFSVNVPHVHNLAGYPIVLSLPGLLGYHDLEDPGHDVINLPPLHIPTVTCLMRIF